jgi:pyruvate kinase
MNETDENEACYPEGCEEQGASGATTSSVPPPDLRKTKIVCTLGPASADEATLARMVDAGMNVARLNSGHLKIEEIPGYIDVLKRAGASRGTRVGVMLDLQGPRLRVGRIKGSSVDLRAGQDLVITTDREPGDAARIPVSYEGLHEDLERGDYVLIDDGLIRLEVEDIRGTDIRCRVLEGGTLLEGKGMNFPGAALRLPSVTDGDRQCLEACLGLGVDWVAQSFVRTHEDVLRLRGVIGELGHSVPVMAKIEKGEAVRNIDSILDAADGVMVARGDLGVEMNTEEVPLIQKELIEKAQRAARPVLTATQMLESMVEHARPTRAEASDVANAILDGTDAVMLSAETAVGAYPVKTVETMRRIADRTERAVDYQELLEDRSRWAHCSSADAIGFAACQIASDLGAQAIITVTRTGYTAKLIARYRPKAQIIAVSSDEAVIDSMSIVWGVEGLVVPYGGRIVETVNRVVEEGRNAGILERGELVVITGGFLDERAGTTNTINVRHVG